MFPKGRLLEGEGVSARGAARRRERSDRILEVVKANYGPTGWGARLKEMLLAKGVFGGLRLVDRLDREGVRAAIQPPRPGKTSGKPYGRDAGTKPVVPINPENLPDDEVPF